MEILEEQRENWGGRAAFVLAAIGSAIGLGNLWAFPFKVYNYGGAAFLIPYIAAMFVVGIPLMILEFSLGHFTQKAAPDAFGRVGKKWEFVGWWGILLSFVIIMYYPVVLAWCFSFLWISIKAIVTGSALPWSGHGIEGVGRAGDFFYKEYLQYNGSHTLGGINWKLFWPLVITWLAMYLCICRGVKLVGWIVWITVPLPWLMLLLLAVRGLTFKGSTQGLAFFLNPDWSQLASPAIWRVAFGQVFFSLSLAFGVMITYASFLHSKSDINNNAVIVCLSDFATSMVCGIVVFATLGAMAHVTQTAGSPVPVSKVSLGGPGLAFVAFPYALAQLPYAHWFSLVFFIALVTLGIDSAFSITESCLAAIIDKTGWKRSIVLPAMTAIGIFSGMLFITRGGLNWLGTVDTFVNGTWGITFMGLLEAVVLSWAYNIDTLRLHANNRSDWRLGKWWNYAVRIFIPVVLGSLFVWNIIDDFFVSGGGILGFFIQKDGSVNLPHCVGMAIMAICPILAVLTSAHRSPYLQPEDKTTRKSVQRKTERLVGIASLAMAILSVLLFAAALNLPSMAVHAQVKWAMIVASVLAVTAGIIAGNFAMDRAYAANAIPSSIARWSGVLSIMVLSTIIAVMLVQLTGKAKIPAVSEVEQTLKGVSYIMLGGVSLLIIAGLVWCFYLAVRAGSNGSNTLQQPEEN